MACSGGRDSTALLHATVRAARPLGVEVHALHVHHGLNAGADAWLTSVRAQCRRWRAVFHARRLQGSPAPGESVEAWARRERHAALQAMAHEAGCTLLLLAHHRRDQAETVLLQALRGSTAAGLASMPKQARREGLVWARPWLDQPRQAVEAYLRRHRLGHVEDSSNDNLRFARNRLRLQVWPDLLKAFPDAESALGAAARHAWQAALLADECAAHDLPPLLLGDALQVAPWLLLPPARRRNALSHWLAGRLGSGAATSLLQRLLIEVPANPAARWPTPQGELQLYRGLLRLGAGAAPSAAPVPCRVDLSPSRVTAVPGWNGRFRCEAVSEGGVPPSLLQQLQARPRGGGERFKLAPQATARSLKLQYQARAVPAWQRHGPLLYTADDRLVFVPGLGLNAELWAAPEAPQCAVHWVPDCVA